MLSAEIFLLKGVTNNACAGIGKRIERDGITLACFKKDGRLYLQQGVGEIKPGIPLCAYKQAGVNISFSGFYTTQRIRPFGRPELHIPANLPGPFLPEIDEIAARFAVDTNC